MDKEKLNKVLAKKWTRSLESLSGEPWLRFGRSTLRVIKLALRGSELRVASSLCWICSNTQIVQEKF